MLNYDLRENIYHGTDQFPVSLYTVSNDTPNSQILPCHWHEHFEIIHVNYGIGHFKIDNSIYTLSEGDAVIVNSRELHSGYTCDNHICNYDALVFDMKFLQNSLDDVCMQEYIKPLLLNEKRFKSLICPLEGTKKQALYILRSLITACRERTPYYELYIKSQLYLLLFMLYASNAVIDCKAEISGKPGVNLDAIKDALNYIDNHFSEKLTIEVIADVARLSKYHFIRVFKATTAMNTTEYINMIRINQAEKCFHLTNLSITEVAASCGFNNLSYFIKIFKNYKKLTPYQYKKMLLSKTIGFTGTDFY